MEIIKTESGIIIRPCHDEGDMEWDLQDVLFYLKMEGAEYMYAVNTEMIFSYCGKTYCIGEYESERLSIGKSVELEWL